MEYCSIAQAQHHQQQSVQRQSGYDSNYHIQTAQNQQDLTRQNQAPAFASSPQHYNHSNRTNGIVQGSPGYMQQQLMIPQMPRPPIPPQPFMILQPMPPGSPHEASTPQPLHSTPQNPQNSEMISSAGSYLGYDQHSNIRQQSLTQPPPVATGETYRQPGAPNIPVQQMQQTHQQFYLQQQHQRLPQYQQYQQQYPQQQQVFSYQYQQQSPGGSRQHPQQQGGMQPLSQMQMQEQRQFQQHLGSAP